MINDTDKVRRRKRAGGLMKAGKRNTRAIRMYGPSPEFHGGDYYGLPSEVSRQWVVEHSEEDELGAVPIPAERKDGVFTHAIYWADCEHIGTELDRRCRCAYDYRVPWSLAQFEG